MPGPPATLLKAALPGMLLAVAVYANSLSNTFAYDDVHVVLDDPRIQDVRRLPETLTEPYWEGEYGKELGLWRPLTTLSFGLQYALVGPQPLLYHVVNVAAHAVVTGLAVVLLAHLMSLTTAALAGILFAVHPVHVEAVANVVGLAEMQSAVFFLLACIVAVRGGSRASWPRAAAIGGLYLLAFGTKESAVTLPGIVFLLDAARRRLTVSDLADYVRDRWNVYALLVVVAGGIIAMRLAVLGSVAAPFGPVGADLLAEVPRIYTLSEIWSHYVRLMVFPLDLSADYSPNVIPVSLGWSPANLTGLLLVLAILGGTLAAWRRPSLRPDTVSARIAAFGVLWFLITISPVSNVAFIAGVLLAERTLYLPSVGIVAAFAWVLVRLYRNRPRVAALVVALVVILGSVRTWARNPSWKDNDTVFGTLLADYPYSGRAQWSLADQFFRLGDTSQGLLTYRAAVGILGPHYMLIAEIAKKLIAADELRSAEVLLEYAYRDFPEFSVAPGLIAVVHSERGDAVETELWARRALAIEDEDPVRQHLLAWALTEQGRWVEAGVARRAAIASGEGDHWQQWASLANIEAEAGDTARVRAALDSARVKAVGEGGIEYIEALYTTLLGDPLRDSTLLTSPQPPDTVAPGSVPSGSAPGR